jgi:hypothetical protein
MKKRKNYIIKNRILCPIKHKYIDWNKVEINNNLPMSGEEITQEIYRQTGVKITRQGVSSALKSAMKKVYLNMKKAERDLEPFQVALKLFEMFFPNSPSSGDAYMFFNLFPESIRREIKYGINEE